MMGDTNLQAPLDRHKSRGSFRALSFGRTRPPATPTSDSFSHPSPAPGNVKPSAYRPKTAPDSPSRLFSRKKHLDKVVRRDSGLAPSNSTGGDSRSTLPPDDASVPSLKSPPSLPSIQVDGGPLPPTSSQTKRGNIEEQDESPESPKMDDLFRPLDIDIPSGTLDDLASPKLNFSKRGSMFIGAKKANATSSANRQLRFSSRRLQPNQTSSRLKPPTPAFKTLSAEEECLSQKVRMMYETGNDDSTTFDDRSSLQDNLATTEDTTSLAGSGVPSATDITSNGSIRGSTSLRRRPSNIKREPHELAGGIEDWQDVLGGDVDRYGFIIHRPPPSELSSSSLAQSSPEPQSLQRVTTSLQLATETPRRKHTIRRATSNAKSTRSISGQGLSRQFSRHSGRPSSQGSNNSNVGGANQRLRYAANRLPHNKDRRLMDEASDMLTLPPGLADIAESEEGGQVSPDSKKKEINRNNKWLKMAKLITKNNDGRGMTFEFDMQSPKLIERTWKGIPDRWRATAWYAFLSASAKRRQGSATDEELISIFHDYQDNSSPDDVQIDIDVPRTINSHIMFRRRYRGGQRLLFRVLHAMSLYFPDTGYVQGMATLAATLLCYYDEDNTFVMLVRLWQLRGLERLYREGFEGLMEALDDFEKKWLASGEVAAKLTELGISPTAYGTRWYLTLFNYSIPFPAQLRVWDVFMLLGDGDDDATTGPSAASGSFGPTLDVLHAASAALIDGTREILLDSDFENAMKVLTSWIPIKDEELFMRVAKAEWKMHRRKA